MRGKLRKKIEFLQSRREEQAQVAGPRAVPALQGVAGTDLRTPTVGSVFSED